MLVKIISIMLQNTYTTDDLVERLEFMRKYYNKSLFTEGGNISLQDVIKDECDEYTLSALKQWVDKFTIENIQPIIIFEALSTVQEDLKGVPSVILYVPVRFTHEQVEGFGVWFRENVQPNILISLRTDPRATGGCSLVWKSMFYDFSLKYFIEREKEKVVSMFNTYSHAK